jgi:hypothetical protein
MRKELYIIGLLIFLLNSCDLIDLTGLEIIAFPSENYQILDKGSYPLITFSKDMRESDNEQFIYIENLGDQIPSDYFWGKNNVELRPKEPLEQGVLYHLVVQGRLITQSGQSYEGSELIPFYSASSAPVNRLESFTPLTEKTINIYDSLTFTFLKEIEKDSFLEEFRLIPAEEYELTIDDLIVTVTPKIQWTNLTRYTWKLDKQTASIDDFFLIQEYEGNFLVQEDIEPPELTDTFSLNYDGNDPLYPSGPDLNSILIDDSICLRWNEPLDIQSLINGLTLEPGLSGIIHQHSSTEFIFSPTERLDFQTDYVLVLDTSISDIAGNSLKEELRFPFTPSTISAMSFDSITVIHAGGSTFLDTYNDDIVYPCEPGSPPRNTLTFQLRFNTAYLSDQEKLRIVDNIRVSVIFPQTNPPIKTYTSWPLDDELHLSYEDFDTGTSYPLYHELRIIGGSKTLNERTGGYFTEDIYVRINTQ